MEKNDDRTELTFLEKQAAYGISVEATKTEGSFKVTFVALSKRPVELRIDEKDGLPKCFGTVNNKPAILKEMFVQTIENWIGLPKVEHIVCKGIDLETGNEVEDKIIP